MEKIGGNPQLIGENQLIFEEKEHNLHEVLEIVAKNKLSLLKMERQEPSLESLFLEVLER